MDNRYSRTHWEAYEQGFADGQAEAEKNSEESRRFVKEIVRARVIDELNERLNGMKFKTVLAKKEAPTKGEKCPNCGGAMIKDNATMYASMPPQYQYKCRDCGFGVIRP